ncbi:MAG: aspartate kinase [bacterium]
MIIMKFGGTSVKDAEAMDRVLKIVSSYQQEKPVIVLSACSGITDKLLYLITNSPKNSKSKSNKIIAEIELHHQKIIRNLINDKELQKQAKIEITKYIEELRRLVEGVKLLKECTDRNTAQAIAYGELLSTTIFHYASINKGLKPRLIDARTIMKTNSRFLNAVVDFQEVKKNTSSFKKIFKTHDLIITQGFIASDSKGITTTLGRGGSDFSAALFGAVLKVQEIQIWTDVTGVLTTDPRLVKSARTIPEISFNEMRELSFYGAKVLHPDTIKHAIMKDIPVRILNTYKPKEKGTLIVKNLTASDTKLHSVILKQSCVECTIDIPSNVNSQKFFSEKLNLLSQHSVKILYSVCTEGNCRIIFDDYFENNKKIKMIINQEKLSLKKVSLFCIAGFNLLSSSQGKDLILKNNVIQEFLTELSYMNPRQIIFGISPVSVLILTSPERAFINLNKIHSFILKNF